MRPDQPAPAIRLWTPADLDQIAALERETFPDPWPRAQLAESLAQPWIAGLVAAEPGGRVAGYAITAVVADEAEIVNLAVAPSWRRRGIGAALLTTALHEAAGRGARTAWLQVRSSNAAARALYEAGGFAVVGRRRSYYARPREDALTMALALDGAPALTPPDAADSL